LRILHLQLLDHLPNQVRSTLLVNQLFKAATRQAVQLKIMQIQVSRRAVEVTPDNHPDLAAWLNNVGVKLESQFERPGRIEDLGEAIQVLGRAVEVTPVDHPDLVGRLNNLGNMLETWFLVAFVRALLAFRFRLSIEPLLQVATSR
jgi:hypothetical protein